MPFSREQYLNFFTANKFQSKDFKFKYICNFDEEVKALQDYFNLDEVRYGDSDPRPGWNRIISQINRHMILRPSNIDLSNGFYTPIVVTEYSELYALCRPIFDKLEKIYDGVVLECTVHNLPPFATIPSHNDLQGYINDNLYDEIIYYQSIHKVHVVITTNDLVFFKVDDELGQMKVNECWEINDQTEHQVFNAGVTDRIHLVINVFNEKWV